MFFSNEAQQTLDQHFTSAACVLHHGGQWRIGETRCWYVIEPHHGNLPRYIDVPFLQCVHGTDGNQITGCDDGIEFHTLIDECIGGIESSLFGTERIHLRGGIDLQTHCGNRFGVAAVALHELRIVIGSVAKESELLAAQFEQMLSRIVATAIVVATDGESRLVGLYRAPANEVRALAYQLFKS